MNSEDHTSTTRARVAQARLRGESWAAIGDALGVGGEEAYRGYRDVLAPLGRCGIRRASSLYPDRAESCVRIPRHDAPHRYEFDDETTPEIFP